MIPRDADKHDSSEKTEDGWTFVCEMRSELVGNQYLTVLLSACNLAKDLFVIMLVSTLSQ